MSAIQSHSSTTPAAITAAAVSSFDSSPDPRLREVMQLLVRHLHAFATEVGLTEAEWSRAIQILTQTGHITDDKRQEFILWSDVLGLSMLVDAIAHPNPGDATESTVLGPFWTPNAPRRAYGESIAEEVQDPDAPESHMRGRFLTRDDGSYAFVGVRPMPYTIPHDGPAGGMLEATRRHPWRPAHIHMIVSAPGYRRLQTHIFDAESPYLDSDVVFAVKPSLIREFVGRSVDDPEKPSSVNGPWCVVDSDLVLQPL